MDINFKEIAKSGWIKNWQGKFSVLIDSYGGYIYKEPTEKLLGKSIDSSLFICESGITTCYLNKSELNAFGQYLAKKVEDDGQALFEWVKLLKNGLDNLRKIISQDIKIFFDIQNYFLFENSYKKVLPLQVAIKIIIDCLPKECVEKYFVTLEEARKYSETMYIEIETFFNTFAEAIAKREELDKTLILSLTREEFISYLKENILPEITILEKRNELCGLLFFANNFYLIGEEIKQLEQEILKKNPVLMPIVKGTTAFPGIVKGICRIIKDPKKVALFNKGDIVVTGMTQPDFVPLINKASAIITDAGGMLCHASIVARELNKPCIVGTETATKIFKDGDFLEVNATEGVVKKLN